MHPWKIALAIVATVVILGGILWVGSAPTKDGESSTQESEQRKNPAVRQLSHNARAAVGQCDSMARAQLAVPDTMEFANEPEVVDIKTTLSVARDIAARDKSGRRYRYRYICSAMADGQGGWTKFSVALMPAND